jgi:hypothetical protein
MASMATSELETTLVELDTGSSNVMLQYIYKDTSIKFLYYKRIVYTHCRLTVIVIML